MTRAKAVGLSAAAVLVLCGVVSSVALAAPPEFSAFPAPFTAKSGVPTTLETVSKATIRCTSDEGTGEVTGPKTGTLKLLLKGCEFVTLAVPCNTVGLPPGEVSTDTLMVTLGYINEPKKEVGIDLSTATGGPLTEFICAGLKVVVVGSVIGKVAPVNKLLKPPAHFTLKFSQAGGKQKPTHFEAGPIDVPMTSFGGPFMESGITSSDSLAFPIPMMIIA